MFCPVFRQVSAREKVNLAFHQSDNYVLDAENAYAPSFRSLPPSLCLLCLSSFYSRVNQRGLPLCSICGNHRVGATQLLVRVGAASWCGCELRVASWGHPVIGGGVVGGGVGATQLLASWRKRVGSELGPPSNWDVGVPEPVGRYLDS